MVEAYVKLIMAGKKTFDQVPERIQYEVLAALEEAGWVPPDD